MFVVLLVSVCGVGMMVVGVAGICGGVVVAQCLWWCLLVLCSQMLSKFIIDHRC